jgi:hypothetical protein
MNGTKLSIRQISILTAVDRDTVTRRLQGLPSEPGAKNSRIYDAPAALRAVLAPVLAPEGTLEQLKARSEFLSAELKQLTLAQRMQDLVPADFVFDLINVFIRYCAGRFDDLRRRGVVKRAWISECEAHWNWQYQEFLREYGLTSPEASQRQQDFSGLSQPAPTPREFEKGPPRSGKDSKGQNSSRPLL